MSKSRNRRKKGKKQGRGRHAGVPIAPARSRTTLAERFAEMPVGECYINEDWRDPLTLATVCVTRRLPEGRCQAVVLLVDLACLGVKDVFIQRYGRGELQGLLDQYVSRLVPCDPALAVKVVTSAVAFARSVGFEPPHDYEEATLFFVGIDPATCAEDVVLGHDGKPLFIAGPHDDVDAVLATLQEWDRKQAAEEPLIISPYDSGGGLAGPDDPDEGLIIRLK